MISANFAKMPSSYTMDSDRCSILRPTFARFSGRPPEAKRLSNPCGSFNFFRFFPYFNDPLGGLPEAKTQRNPGTRRTPNLTTLCRFSFVVLRCFFVAFRVPAVKDDQNHIEFTTLRRLFELHCVAWCFSDKRDTGLSTNFLTRIEWIVMKNYTKKCSFWKSWKMCF